MLTRIFGLNREKITTGRKQMHNLCSSPNIIRDDQEGLREEGHRACMKRLGDADKISNGESEEKIDHFGNLGTEGRIILKWILKKYYVRILNIFSWL
jgi:hypothetical protein